MKYGVLEARAGDADAVLLIAALLDGPTLARLRLLATSLGMAALVEVHSECELETAWQPGPCWSASTTVTYAPLP